MASFIPGSAFNQIRGSVGGSTFDIARSGPTLRKKFRGTKSVSEAQQLIKSLTAVNNFNYRNLSAQDRKGWIVAAQSYPHKNRFGKPCTMSGQNLFNMLNYNLQLIGHSPVLTVPPMANPCYPVIASYSSNYAASSLTITVTNYDAAHNRLLLFSTPPQSPGIQTYLGNQRIISVAPAIVGPYNLFTDVATKYGQSARPGQAIWVSIKAINIFSGIASADSTMQLIIS